MNSSMSSIPQIYQDMMQRSSPFAAAMAAAQLSSMAHHKMNALALHSQLNPMALAALSHFKNPASHMTLNEMNQTRRGRPPRALNLSENRSRSRSPHSNASPKSLNTRTSTPSKSNEDDDAHTDDDIEIDQIEEDDYVDELDNSDLNTTTTSSKSARRAPLEDASKLTPPPPPPQAPVYDFSLQALEMSLYGYLRQNDAMFMGHAISGLRYLAAQQQQQLHQQQLQHKLHKSSHQDEQSKQGKSIGYDS
ncbi:hypothetical protein BpHYR1_020540 [Brachionus plicatilis]|uniref:Uncharacterized protein n=1 Tax=Brachionus plicatilis TaxID=10195 RepID=A0A3M7S8G2_BRAPC|nr:hypothetical protein BpHYR1_020540 [Brachionus plicatilis]